jgi:hypothetical protein
MAAFACLTGCPRTTEPDSPAAFLGACIVTPPAEFKTSAATATELKSDLKTLLSGSAQASQAVGRWADVVFQKAASRNEACELVARTLSCAVEHRAAEAVQTGLTSVMNRTCPAAGSAFEGVWTGEVSGTAARPRGAPLSGAVRVTVSADGKMQGQYVMCSPRYPGFVVRGTLTASIGKYGKFTGSYNYQQNTALTLKLTGVVGRINDDVLSGDFTAPTDTNSPSVLDAFHGDFKRGGDLPDVCANRPVHPDVVTGSSPVEAPWTPQ